jgi:hypothetical protein
VNENLNLFFAALSGGIPTALASWAVLRYYVDTQITLRTNKQDAEMRDMRADVDSQKLRLESQREELPLILRAELAEQAIEIDRRINGKISAAIDRCRACPLQPIADRAHSLTQVLRRRKDGEEEHVG